MGPDQIKQKQAEALEKMSDVFEEATEDFFRTHPDPFDERAPHSISPGCKLGLLQKSLSGKKLSMKLDSKIIFQNIQNFWIKLWRILLLRVRTCLYNELLADYYFSLCQGVQKFYFTEYILDMNSMGNNE